MGGDLVERLLRHCWALLWTFGKQEMRIDRWAYLEELKRDIGIQTGVLKQLSWQPHVANTRHKAQSTSCNCREPRATPSCPIPSNTACSVPTMTLQAGGERDARWLSAK